MSDMRRRTRWLRELAEPQPVRRADVWSFDRAAQSVRLDSGLARGTVHARLVDKPEQNASQKNSLLAGAVRDAAFALDGPESRRNWAIGFGKGE